MPVIRINAEQTKKGRNKESPGRNWPSGFACLKLLVQMVRPPSSEIPRSTLGLKIKQLNIKKYTFQ
jgi:hypothetical protein